VTYPPASTSPHSHLPPNLLHSTLDMYRSQPKFVDILTFVPCGKNTQHSPSNSHLSHTHACYIHTHPQESAKHLGPDTVPSTLTAVKKVGFLLSRPRVEPPHPTTLAQCHPIPPWPLSCLYPLQLSLPKFTPLYHNTLLTKLHHPTSPQRPPSDILQNTQSTHPTLSPPHTHQEKMDTSPKGSPPDHEEVLHTFTILKIHNAPDNSSSFGLITFLDAAVAHSSETILTPTFLEYDYNQMELANRDNILRLLVRNATPQEDINYYDITSQLLSSDLLRDHESGLLAAYPCADKVWLDRLQGKRRLLLLLLVKK